MEQETQLTTLPTIFKNVKSLVLKSTFPSPTPLVTNTQLLHQVLKNWANIEAIVDLSYYFILPIHLLQSTTCNRLTSIDISFQLRLPINKTRNKLKTLLASIHNAPALESVTFRDTVIKLVDMENLNRATTKL